LAPSIIDVQPVVRPPGGKPDKPLLVVAWNPRTARHVTARMDQIVTCSFCGETQSGKTYTVSCYLCQLVRQGVQLAIGDHHAGNDRSLYTRTKPLAPWYWRPPAQTKPTAVRLTEEFVAELRRRQDAGRALEKVGRVWTPGVDGPFLVLVLDEFNGLLRYAKARLAELIMEVTEEGTKWGMFSFLSGQHWTVEAMRTSELRDTIPSTVVHRCRKSMAAMVTGRREQEVEWSQNLPPGWVYISLTNGHPTADAPGGPYQMIRMTDLSVQRVADHLGKLRRRTEAQEAGEEASAPSPVEEAPVARSGMEIPPLTRYRFEQNTARFFALLQAGMDFPQAALVAMGGNPQQSGKPRIHAARLAEEAVLRELRRLQALTEERSTPPDTDLAHEILEASPMLQEWAAEEAM
jgi:hypothetical protein